MGFQATLGTQNHVPTPTIIRFVGGEVRINNVGTSRETFFAAVWATRGDASVRIHWYPTILFPHALKNNVSWLVVASLLRTVSGSMPLTVSHTHPSSAGGASKRTWASMFSPSVLPDPDPCAQALGGW
jgi:hypothetical protein